VGEHRLGCGIIRPRFTLRSSAALICGGVGFGNAHGPIPADALIPAAVRGKWNMIIACYRDQGHAPFKAVYGDDGVNITVGLPVVRVSVDHGTAFDIAGRGIAREASLVLSCRRAAELAPGWDNVWQAARQSQTASA
jgi:4-hydroxy-L-threonine phosphate dehydrogenase PdxA